MVKAGIPARSQVDTVGSLKVATCAEQLPKVSCVSNQLIAMPKKNILVLFDVDGTLTVPRGEATEEIKEFLQQLRQHVTVGIVGGSDLVKQEEQMGRNIVNEVDYSFSENGLVAYKNGALIGKTVSYVSVVQLYLTFVVFGFLPW